MSWFASTLIRFVASSTKALRSAGNCLRIAPPASKAFSTTFRNLPSGVLTSYSLGKKSNPKIGLDLPPSASLWFFSSSTLISSADLVSSVAVLSSSGFCFTYRSLICSSSLSISDILRLLKDRIDPASFFFSRSSSMVRFLSASAMSSGRSLAISWISLSFSKRACILRSFSTCTLSKFSPLLM